MKKIITVLVAAVAVTLSSCGKSQCDTLQDLCNACNNATAKSSCSAVVSTYKLLSVTSDASCKAVIDAKTYDTAGTLCK